MTIDDHIHVELKERCAFRYDHHVSLSRRLENLLALLAPRLVIALHADSAVSLLALKMRERIVEIGDYSSEARLRAVQNGSGGENSRSDDFSRALHFARCKNLVGVVRRIVQGRHAE